MTNNEKKLKLAQAKVNQAKKQRSEEEAARVKEYERYIEQTNKYVESVVEGLGVVLETQVSEAYDKLQELYKDFSKLSDHTTKERTQLEEKLLEVTKALEKGVRVTNIKEAKADKVTIPPLPQGLAKDLTLKGIQESLEKIAKAQQDPVVAITPESQKAPDFLPFRRVVSDGKKLVFDDSRPVSGGGAGTQAFVGLTDEQLRATPVDVTVSAVSPTYYQGTVSATAVNVVGLIDGASFPFIEFQHRGTQGQFKFTVLIEGTDDPTATGDEAAGAASTAKGWTSLEVRAASGAEMSSIVLGGRYLLFNPPRFVRVRCSAYTRGTAQIDVIAKTVNQSDPSRVLQDRDGISYLAMTTFGQAQVAQRTYLAGGNFDTASLNTNIWTNTNSGGSHVFANGVIELHSGTGATGKGGVQSINVADVLGAVDNAITMRTSVSATTEGKYVYRVGNFNSTDGFFIQMAGNARTVTDAVFNATTTMTSATGDFTAADLGKVVTSSGNVTIGTTIVQINSSTSVTLSAAALTTASAQTVDIEGFGAVYVNRKASVDTTSPFGIIGFGAVTITANVRQLWEAVINPNLVFVRLSGAFVQLQIGATELTSMFNEYDLPLTAEVENLGSTIDHILYVQTLTAERLGQPSTIRAGESFQEDDVLSAVAAIQHGRQPDGDFVGFKADGVAFETTTELGSGVTYDSRTDNGYTDSDGWGSIELVIKCDQVSATNGIVINYVDDVDAGSPIVIHTERFTYSAANVTAGSTVITRTTHGDGFYVTYQNGGTLQGTFHLQCNLRVENTLPQNSLESDVSGTNQSVMTRGGLFAANPSGVYGLIGRGTSGGMDVGIVQHEVETPVKSLPTLKVTRKSVTGTASEITSSAPLAGRRSVSLKAICSGSTIVYVGQNNSVTTSNGWPLSNDQSIDLEVDDTTLIWVISSSGTQAVSVAELGT